MDQNMMDILDAREQRAFRQRQLLRRFGKPLVCFTMNIPGPEKNHPLADMGFSLGSRLLTAALPPEALLFSEHRQTAAGWEGFFVADLPAEKLKAIAVGIEEGCPAGRVFDMDVITPAGEKLDRQTLGFAPRKCLLCRTEAAVCGRSRTHSPEELLAETLGILRKGISGMVGELAVRSLLCELYATPKPGLVDRRNSGSHQDMDIFTFLRSAAVLWPYFDRCVEIGMENPDPEPAFGKLREAGKAAEEKMLAVTGGVNTHKGAIFTMGLLCGAVGMLPPDRWADSQAVCDQCAVLARGLISRDMGQRKEPETTGEKLFIQFGITGARGQAEAGLPGARLGLEVLEEGLKREIPFNDVLCAVLLHILAATQDTNLIKRGGRVGQMQLQVFLKTMLQRCPYPDRKLLEELDDMFIRRDLSPGGSADLLAAACFLHFLKS